MESFPSVEDEDFKRTQTKSAVHEDNEAAAPLGAIRKQFWMDDETCKKCHSCEKPFSVLRRKHHCRACGRIFCSSCSNRSIDGAEYGYQGLVRACSECYDFVCRLKRQRALHRQQATSDVGEDSELGSDEDNAEDTCDDTFEEDSQDGIRPSIPRLNAARTMSFDNLSTSLPSPTSTSPLAPSSRRAFHWSTVRGASGDSQSARRMSWKELLSVFQLENETFESMVNNQRKSFKESVKSAISKQLEKEIFLLRDARPGSILESATREEWRNVFVDIIDEFVNAVKPWRSDKAPLPKMLGLESVCQIISVPGGRISESGFVNGVVCEENVIHRRMRTKISRPRIMLLSGALEFFPEKTRITSFDTLKEQEDEYIRLLVKRISDVGVDLLIVGSSVCRVAQDLLLACNISVVVNIDENLMARVARMTGALILPTINQIKHNENPTGSCSLWRVLKFSMELSAAQESEQLEPIQVPKQLSKRSKTVMFFEGRKSNDFPGGSIYLRGGHPTTMRRMVKILSDVIPCIYVMELHQYLLHDLGVYSPEHKQIEKELLSRRTIDVSTLSLHGTSQVEPASRLTVTFGDTSEKDPSLGAFLRLLFTSNQFHPLANANVIKATSAAPKLETRKPPLSTQTKKVGSIQSTATQTGLVLASSRLDEGVALDANSSSLVYFNADSRVYVFKGILSRDDPFETQFRDTLMNVRREYVAKSLKKWEQIPDAKDQAYCSATKLCSDHIVTWSECSKCNASTRYSVLSKQSEFYSIARWIQLKFFWTGKNELSLDSEGTVNCKHSVFQEYITYFEFLGQVVGFEYEKKLRYTVSTGTTYVRETSEFDTLKLRIADLVEKMRVAFLEQGLLLWTENNPNDSRAALVDKLATNIEASLRFQLEILETKRSTLHLNYIRRSLLELARQWNDELSEIDNDIMLAAIPLLQISNDLEMNTQLELQSGFGNSFVVVYEEESTSWIAYALNSKDHRQYLYSFAEKIGVTDLLENGEWSKILNLQLDSKITALAMEFSELPTFSFSIKAYNALQFYALRELCFNGGEQNMEFLESLSRCTPWQATGGKSKSHFYKTQDQRFVVKSITTEELDLFQNIHSKYFSHLECILGNDLPTALVKIFGVYTVYIREKEVDETYDSVNEDAQSPRVVGGETQDSHDKAETPAVSKIHLIVMENLFQEDFAVKFDLKGTFNRNRQVMNPQKGAVLMDLNFREYMEGLPLTLTTESKQTLVKAIENDTHFLEACEIVDYSILVGVPKSAPGETKNPILKIGLIDFLQRYNYKKMIESNVKKAGMIAGADQPTGKLSRFLSKYTHCTSSYWSIGISKSSTALSRHFFYQCCRISRW